MERNERKEESEGVKYRLMARNRAIGMIAYRRARDASLLERSLNLCLGIHALLALCHAVFAEVKGLLFHSVVLADVAILGCPQERLDALRVVAEGEEEVLFSQVGLNRLLDHIFENSLIFLL